MMLPLPLRVAIVASAVATTLAAAAPASAQVPGAEVAPPTAAGSALPAPPAEPPVLTEPLGADQDAVYRGSGDRKLRGYRPGPLSALQARSRLAGTDRFAIVVNQSTIELLHGATVLRTLPHGGGQLTIPGIAQVVDDDRWIARVEPGTYLLKAALVHGAGTSLKIGGRGLRELRLADRPDVFLGGTDGARAIIVDTRVVGWDERRGDVDTDHEFSRPFIVYGRRSRLDVMRAEIAYLGYDRGAAYGLSWRTGGATGSVVDSDIHHMFFGMYTYEARDIELRRSRWHDCVYYGIDPHDFTTGMRIVDNDVYRNGSHGIIISRGVNDARISGNRSYHNRGNGIVIDASSDDSTVWNNDVRDNRGDGVVVLGSSRATVANNRITGNRVGVRVNLRALDNRIRDNVITGNRVGVQIYDGALGTKLRRNRVQHSDTTGILLDAGDTQLEGDVVSGATVGVSIIGIGKLDGVRIHDVDRALDVRSTGIMQGHDLLIDAREVGVRLRAGAEGELYDSQVAAAEPIVGDLRRDADNALAVPFAWLTAAGVLFLTLAVVFQVVHSLRNRPRRILVAPEGVSNVR